MGIHGRRDIDWPGRFLRHRMQGFAIMIQKDLMVILRRWAADWPGLFLRSRVNGPAIMI